MNRNDLITAISSGDIAKIKELKETDQEKKGGYLFADLNEDQTWNIPLLDLYQDKNKDWKRGNKHRNLTHETFARLIVKKDYQVMATGYYVNTKFPEGSDAYQEPDPNMTDEMKYLEILQDLKEVAKLWTERIEQTKSDHEQQERTN